MRSCICRYRSEQWAKEKRTDVSAFLVFGMRGSTGLRPTWPAFRLRYFFGASTAIAIASVITISTCSPTLIWLNTAGSLTFTWTERL